MSHTKLGRIFLLCSLTVGILISSSSADCSATSKADIAAALKQAWKGEPASAIAMLKRFVVDHPQDQRARLAYLTRSSSQEPTSSSTGTPRREARASMRS